MKNILITLVLIVSSSLIGQDLWRYVNAGADAIVYINTENGEKNMDPEIWEKIQREKKEAIAVDQKRAEEAKEYTAKRRAEAKEKGNADENDKAEVYDEKDEANEFKFDTKDRHIELLVNIFSVSTSPMVANMEGAIKMKGGESETSPLQDFKKLLEDQKENSAVSQKKLKVEGRDAYAIDSSTNINGKNTPVNSLIVPIDANTFEFKMVMNSEKGVVPSMLPKSNGTMAMTEGLMGSDFALAFACNTQKLASMMNGEMTPQMMALKNYLMQTDVGKITCRIAGRDAQITLMVHFFDPTVAQGILGQIKQFTTALNSHPIISQYVRDINPIVNGDQFIITAKIDVEKGWAIVRKFHQE